MNLIVLAIPVFLALIAVEFLITWRSERPTYHLADAVNDLSCGLLQQLTDVFLKTALFAGYVWLYSEHRLATLPASSVWVWAACFVGVDFFYYWFHRTSHEVGAVWAAHVVHHQSEDFNLAVALRQGALQGAFSWVFYLPLALVGFPPLVFLTVSSINTLYQFWIHTETIGRLGPLEWIMNTPSHHRVHHGRNPEYIDRNHAGMFIVWDRLFGTFEPEGRRVVYGITTPLRSWNPLWANVHYWIELWRSARGARRALDSVRFFLKPPGWRPADMGGPVPAPPVDASTYSKFEIQLGRRAAIYALVQFAILVGGAAVFLFRLQSVTTRDRAIIAAFVVLSLVSLGAWLEGRRWAQHLEGFRVIAAGAMAVWLLGSSGFWIAGMALLSLPAIIATAPGASPVAYPLEHQN